MGYPNKHETYIDKSSIHGVGVFSVHSIKANEKIMMVGNLRLYKHGGDNKWITPMARKVNHQKNANCEVRRTNDCYYLWSLKDIKAGEELTNDYTTLPSPPFGKNINGFKEL